MAESPENRRPARRAESVFRAWLEANDGTPFEELCKRHPDIETALRVLYDAHLDGSPDACPSTATEGSSPTWPSSAAEELHPGAVIGPYRLETKLGEGGFGVVYLALQTEPVTCRVAFKALRESHPPRDALVRFEIERQALAVMNHPSIPSFLGAGETASGRRYYAMEYVEGLPLTQFCDERALGVTERLELFVDVCDAIRHAHLRGVIHRDLKPRNVLVTTLDEGPPLAKVIDFGLAKGLDRPIIDVTEVTEEGFSVGTLLYMPPEQAGVIDDKVDTRADVYALGVILYELLAGTRPLSTHEPNVGEYLKALRSRVPAPLSTAFSRLEREDRRRTAERRGLETRQLRRRLEPELDLIVQKALEKKPDDRYGAVADLLEDVHRFLRHEPLQVATGAFYRARKFWQRHRVGVSVAALILLLVIGGFALDVAADYIGRIREAERLYARGNDLWSSYVQKNQRTHGFLRERWLRAWKEQSPEEGKGWLPVWEREEELAAWRALEEARSGLESLFSDAIFQLQSAIDMAPEGSEILRVARRSFSRIHLELSDEVRKSGPITLGDRYFERFVRALGEADHVKALEGGALSLRSEPPGAEVYCFRYVDLDGRLQPFPFNPELGRLRAEDGTRARPFLQVDREWDESEFEEGDRILEVNGLPVSKRADLARALRGVAEHEAIPVRVRRRDREMQFSWIPFEGARQRGLKKLSLEPGVLRDIRLQLGIAFAGYPLELTEYNRLGTTNESAPLEVTLPRGSYLLVLQRKGDYADVRYPLALPEDAGLAETVRLPKRSEIPDGFVYIPAGRAATGGDPRADQALPWGNERVEAFCIGRCEVTVAEWLAFLNHDDVRDRVAKDGLLTPVVPEVVEQLRKLPKPGEELRLRVVPVDGSGRRLFQQEPDERWTARSRYLAWPIIGVSQLAAREYAAWRTGQAETNSEPWAFRLPTDLEWERAARGIDRRVYSWGSYMVWSFCASHNGKRDRNPQPIGSYPLDESVFGVRDVTGSVREWTPQPVRLAYVSVRGGSFRDTEDIYFRLASRNGLYPRDSRWECGVRLVAERVPRPHSQ